MSDSERRSSGSVTPWLMGLVLLVWLAAVVAAFVPVVPCPSAHHEWDVYTPPPMCGLCKDKLRVSLLGKWINGQGQKQ